MWLEIHHPPTHPPTWTPLRRIMGSSSEIHGLLPAKNTGCSNCHLRRTFYLSGWERCMPKFQTLVCTIQWSSQPNIFAPWKFFEWWTINPDTIWWLYCQMHDFPGGKLTNNTFGNDGYLSTGTEWEHSLLYNWVMSCYWGRTILSIGP